MVAIESDIDATHIASFRETMRFLRTEADTLMGPGVGLDFVNSFWFYGPRPNGAIENRMMYLQSFTDLDARSPHAAEIEAYLEAGWAGVLHSYGRLGQDFRRGQASFALDSLARLNVRPRIWTNHGRNGAQNILADARPNPLIDGDLPDTPAYHADLLWDFGVKYYWTGKQGSVVGGRKDPARPARLRDGRLVWRFARANGLLHGQDDYDYLIRQGASPSVQYATPRTVAWQPSLLDLSLSTSGLQTLVEEGHFCIFAQHLGNLGGSQTFSPNAVAALRALRSEQDAGRILVASTERLLDFYVARAHLDFDWRVDSGGGHLDLTAIDDPVTGRRPPTLDEARGISFALPLRERSAAPTSIAVTLAGKPVDSENLYFHRDADALIFGLNWHDVDRRDATPADKRATPQPDAPRSKQGRAALGVGETACADDRLYLAPAETPYADVLTEMREAASPSERRILAATTVNALLSNAVETAATASARRALAERLWADALQRLKALSGPAGARIPADRAEAERALYWAGLHSFGETMATPDATPDLIGRRELFYACRSVQRDALQPFRAARSRTLTGVLFEQIDYVAETFGGAGAMAMLADAPPALRTSPRGELRALAFEPAAAPEAILRALARLRGPSAARDRLLAARALAGRGDYAASAAALGRLSNARALALRAAAALADNRDDTARALFAQAFDNDPADQFALIGLLFADDGQDWNPAIERYFAAASSEAAAARDHIVKPRPQPRWRRLRIWRQKTF